MSKCPVSTEVVVDRKDDVNANADLLKALGRLWRQYDKRGLEVRLQTGAVLNTHLGSPSERQLYGVTVLKKVAEELNLSVSDLSRMRGFAHHFTSIAELKAQHPAVSSWTDVKTLLVKLRSTTEMPASAGDTDEKESQVKKRALRHAIQAIEAVQKHAAGIGQLTPGSDDWTALNTKLRDLVAYVENTNLGVCCCAIVPSLGLAKIPVIDQMDNGFVTTHETNGQIIADALLSTDPIWEGSQT